jgi:uncharacterized membrane protein YbaN (DUF454 family)
MVKNLILKFIGSISLVLGMLGALLPLLPSTCFILLAAWAFSQSSPQFHHWMYYRSPFSNTIQSWQQHRVIASKVKAVATLSLVSSFAITAMVIQNLMLLSILGSGMIALLVYLLTRSSDVDNKIMNLHSCESHPRVN